MITVKIHNFQSIQDAKIIIDGFTVVTGTNNSGKALAHGTHVATPSGWVPVEQIVEGQMVLAGDGTPTSVKGVFPQGVCKVTTVTFDDGRLITVDGDHQWRVCIGAGRFPSKGGNQKWQVLTTRQIRAQVGDAPTGTMRPAIPVAGTACFNTQDQPLDPYLMGVLLGHGSFRGTIRVSSADGEILKRVAELVPEGVTLNKCGKYDFRLVTGRGYPNPVLSAIRALGLGECMPHNKWVPDVYSLASPVQRLALLQGLMDTDGSVNKAGIAEFYSSSEKLAQAVLKLVYSFGGAAIIRRQEMNTCSYKGRQRKGILSYTVTFRLPGVAVFRLGRKKDLLGPFMRRAQPLMVSLLEAGEAECTCIAVDHPSHLFQVDGHLVTHNTAVQRAMLGVFQNTGGTAFIRHGAKECSVEIDFGDNKVKWTKGTAKKSRPTYIINDGDPVHPGSAVPDEVVAMGVHPIPVGGYDVWPTIAQQFTGQVFLLDKPGSVLAEAVADVERVGQLNRALRLSESDRRSAQSELKVRRADLIKYEQDAAYFDQLDGAIAAVATLGEQRAKLVTVQRAHQMLAGLQNRLITARQDVAAFAGIDAITIPTENVSTILADLDALRSLHDRLMASTSEVDHFNGLPTALDKISETTPQRLLAAVNVLQGLKDNFDAAQLKVSGEQGELEEAEQDLVNARFEAKEALAEVGACPVCGEVQ